MPPLLRCRGAACDDELDGWPIDGSGLMNEEKGLLGYCSFELSRERLTTASYLFSIEAARDGMIQMERTHA